MTRTRIIWEPGTAPTAEMFRLGRPLLSAVGGEVYNVQAALALASAFDLEMSDYSLKRASEGPLAYWNRMRRATYDVPLVVRQPQSVVFGGRTPGVRYVGMVHHFDPHLDRSSLAHRWYTRRLQQRLRTLDAVFTVSRYSAEQLRSYGCRDVRVIYNAFDPGDYQVGEIERLAFRRRYGFPDDRPVIYIGNAARAKGVYDVYDALKAEPYHLVMSGPKNYAPDLPVQFLHLEHRQYISMLHNCDVVICMSRMVEGWNRIAHEAMLCGRPVIGSGTGGMRELLEGGGQRIVTATQDLPAVVAEVRRNAGSCGARGQAFVGQFDLAYFRKAWIDAVSAILAR